MADFMISYASADAELAHQVAHSLQALGSTVWMDDASAADDTRQLVGLPGGQAHWTVISTAMDEAGTILVVETPAWHSREYCQKELAYARRTGKRLAVVLGPTESVSLLPEAVPAVKPDQLGALVTALRPGDDLARAHARLLRDMASPRRRRLLSRADRDQAQDAERIATTTLTPFGISLSAELAVYCHDILHLARARSRARNGAAAGVIAVLVAAAAVALVSRNTALLSERNAHEQADYARALLLAQQADHETNTAVALALAHQAVALHESAATRATLSRVQSAASAVFTTATPSGISLQVAISNDGNTVLSARGNSILVVTPSEGTVRSVAAPATLGRRLVVTPDGEQGYALTRTGDLVCIKVRDATARGTTPEGGRIVDLQVAADGTLFWLTGDGTLRHSSSCPDTTATTLAATGLAGAEALGIDPAGRLAVTVTASNLVHGYPLDGIRSPASPLWTVDLAAVPKEGPASETGEHDTRALASVQFCGDVAHVLTGVKYSLPASTHLAVSPDGTPIGPRTSNVLMVGVGCGPDRAAWASPAITPSAVALPNAASYPVGVVDSADRGGQNVIANSADGSHTVLAHSDGRIQVLDNAAAPWGTDAGRAAVAVPLANGVAMVDQDGTVRLRTGAATATLGSIGGAPAPNTVALPDRAIVASGRTIYAIDSQSVTELGQAPGLVTSLATSLGDDRIIVGSDAGWLAIGFHDDGAIQLTAPQLSDGDDVFAVQLDGDRALWNTHYGRLIITNLGGTIRYSTDLGVAGGNVAIFNADHSIVAMGSDGLMHLYSASLEPIRTTMFGSGALSIHPTPNGRVAVLGLNDFSVWAVDLSSQQALGRVQYHSPDIRLVVPTADGRTVVRLVTTGSGDSYKARLEVIPMPHLPR